LNLKIKYNKKMTSPVTIITGASKGIGKELALGMAS
jgi:short-subunit dehydrogenase